ncbi:YggS family pyridoxal phosphate-dependent enzyme [Flavobacteriales bacterium AH-315-E23]|nr:YggS family pyridoxal phosphate-dependent enzyme [Flavobacteriales bacterium AH-315-E23]
MSIASNLNNLNQSLPDDIRLVAVSKTKPVADIKEAYDAGHRLFGENRVQEMAEKHGQLPPDIEWHAIGHLQRNKVKYISSFVSLIHSVDSLRLLNTIEAEGAKHGRTINCLLQVHIAEEESKSGFTSDELNEIMKGQEIHDFKHINIKGLMGMATYTENTGQIRAEFQTLKSLFSRYDNLEILSMGMSGDYNIAIEEGSNMVRLGSLIFGERN